ncbi:hypothetical protein V5O48_007094 [Marasmius crinis-equi]|uniref:Uncharacterized protein n=1 Tax=Marasmius crinis-equi TaxID=585013 RepID=A0ABR3FHP9_9AGAR
MASLTAEDLLRNKDVGTGFTFADGLVAVIATESREFVTLPNCVQIPRPPMGSTRDLYRRSDGFYSANDPVVYPQPLHPKYRYLACMPSIPRSHSDPYFEDSCMWDKYEQRQFDLNGDGRALNDLTSSIYQLCTREKNLLLSQPTWKALFAELDLTIDLCLHRLSSVSMASQTFIMAISELQRAWRTAIAVIDFAEIYQPRMMATGALEQVYEGNTTAQECSIGIPVHLIRRYADFSQQRILRVGSFAEPFVVSTAASPSYPVIYMGQAGSDTKFAAIRAASISCFDTPSPFANLHLPGAYQSSYSIGTGTSIISPSTSQPSTSNVLSSGPARTAAGLLSSSKPYKQTKRKGKAPKVGQEQNIDAEPPRDLFVDLPPDSSFVPPAIAAWKDANGFIDKSHPGKREMLPGDHPRLKTVAPDPGLVLGPLDVSRQVSYLCQWSHIWQPFLVRSQADGGDKVPVPLRAGMWRKVLSVAFHGLPSKTIDSSKKLPRQAQWHQQVMEWLKTLFEKFAPGVNITASTEATVDSASGRRMIYELSMLNFWYQLMSLDEIADTTIPVPSSGVSKTELLIQRAAHRRHRLKLIDEVFGGYGSPFAAISLSQEGFSSSQNIGLTSERWPDRLVALKALWRLMDSWPGQKGPLWNRGNHPNLAQMEIAGDQWERVLVQFYVQSYYNHLSYPPVLPRRI